MPTVIPIACTDDGDADVDADVGFSHPRDDVRYTEQLNEWQASHRHLCLLFCTIIHDDCYATRVMNTHTICSTCAHVISTAVAPRS